MNVTDAAQNFLTTVLADRVPDDAEVQTALDGLFTCYHSVRCKRDVAPDNVAPDRDYQHLYHDLARRFRDYDWYQSSGGCSVTEAGKAGAGDPIDDLTDIVREMQDVLWYAENSGAQAALWSFKETYFHWGRHARELSLYLHNRASLTENRS